MQKLFQQFSVWLFRKAFKLKKVDTLTTKNNKKQIKKEKTANGKI